MNLIRKLKLSEILPINFTEHEQEIIDLFNEKLSDLVVFIDESKPYLINYMKPDDTSFIMQQDNRLDRLLIRYQGFWEVLESKFSMEYHDIRNLMIYMIERTLKINVSILVYMKYTDSIRVKVTGAVIGIKEIQLKLKI